MSWENFLFYSVAFVIVISLRLVLAAISAVRKVRELPRTPLSPEHMRKNRNNRQAMLVVGILLLLSFVGEILHYLYFETGGSSRFFITLTVLFFGYYYAAFGALQTMFPACFQSRYWFPLFPRKEKEME